MEGKMSTNQSYSRVEKHHPPDATYSIIFEFEKNFNHTSTHQWMEQHWHQCFYYIAIYLLLIYYGQLYMKNRPRFELRLPLFMWNMSLAIFSILGTIRTWPEMLFGLREYGLLFTVCDNGYMCISKVTAFWSWSFVFSKLPELVDTMFVVLRKQELIFLHWYHHVTVLWACWFAYTTMQASARWYICLNYFVHSWMYSYFALRALGTKFPKGVSMFITTIQTLQMLIACYTTWLGQWAQSNGHPCKNSLRTTLMGGGIAFSYLILFSLFFYRAYLSDKAKKSKDKLN